MSEWFLQNGKQVRTVPKDCIARAKVIPAQAPQYRQEALIRDFLDLANLSLREEAALHTNRIKDQPEGSRLQNLALATRTGRVLNGLPINRCESLGSGKKKRSFTGIHRQLQWIFPHLATFRRHFCRMCTSSAACYFWAPSVTILTSLQPAVNLLPGYSSGKPVQDQVARGFVL